MTVSQLAERHRALFGEPTRSRNRDYLRKRLAWRIQELAEGGLAPLTLARIVELGDALPERWLRRRPPQPTTSPDAAPAAPPAPLPAAVAPTGGRDPRLPPSGTVLRRVFGGAAHEVTVTDTAFEYEGRAYKTLSAVAKQISGTPWNGFTFFGLKKAPEVVS